MPRSSSRELNQTCPELRFDQPDQSVHVSASGASAAIISMTRFCPSKSASAEFRTRLQFQTFIRRGQLFRALANFLLQFVTRLLQFGLGFFDLGSSRHLPTSMSFGDSNLVGVRRVKISLAPRVPSE